jgi:hypothetical protein
MPFHTLGCRRLVGLRVKGPSHAAAIRQRVSVQRVAREQQQQRDEALARLSAIRDRNEADAREATLLQTADPLVLLEAGRPVLAPLDTNRGNGLLSPPKYTCVSTKLRFGFTFCRVFL